VAFPGLRVGWVIAPRPLIERLTETKQWSDLHTDQLSQAVLLRFAESGRLEQHRQRMIVAGRERLHAALEACAAYLPPGARFTHPRGGMSLPGRFFAVSRPQPNGLRISFAGMTPEEIRSGLAILGRIFREELEHVRAYSPMTEVAALV
jgi:2-aminoadipate transaminase